MMFEGMLQALGRPIYNGWRAAGEFTSLTREIFYWLFIGPFHGRSVKKAAVLDQMVFMGAKSIMIVVFVLLFTGLVLGMQSAQQLTKMGGTIYVASLVSISICRELGPVLTALVIAGRIGAAITAEIGSMKVNEQIEALDTMGINPVRFLMVPKLISLFIMLPCLTVIGDYAGIVGGYIVGVYNLNINHHLYLQTMFKYLDLSDIYTGLFKSFVFALIIVLVGCHQGMTARDGAVGVGRATTISVVTSFTLIIVADCLVTAFFYFSRI